MDLAVAFEDSQPFRLTVDTYLYLFEQGLISQSPRTELIEGLIVCMNAQAVPHVLLTNKLTSRLGQRLEELGSSAIALVGPTVLMPPHNAADPDIFVGHLSTGRYFDASDALLLIEVSHTTLRKDMKVKLEVYAKAGVPEYWVVDVNKAIVHRFHQPADGMYQQEPPIPLAGPLHSLTIPDLHIDGSGIL